MFYMSTDTGKKTAFGAVFLNGSDASEPFDYTRNATIKSATMFKTLIIGLIAGPAVSL